LETKSDIKHFDSIKKGDIKAYETLFRAYFKPLVVYSERITGDHDDANEVVQDIFMKLWDKRESLEIRSTVNSYLYRAVYNNSLQLLRRKKLDLKYRQYNSEHSYESTNPGSEMIATELNHKIGILLEELPENCKTIFKMNRFTGMKYREIADQLSISIKTVEANMTKALKHFRENLSEYTVKQ